MVAANANLQLGDDCTARSTRGNILLGSIKMETRRVGKYDYAPSVILPRPLAAKKSYFSQQRERAYRQKSSVFLFGHEARNNGTMGPALDAAAKGAPFLGAS